MEIRCHSCKESIDEGICMSCYQKYRIGEHKTFKSKAWKYWGFECSECENPLDRVLEERSRKLR